MRRRNFIASNELDLENAFARFVQDKIGAFLLTDPFFVYRREQIIAAAANHQIPGVYFLRECGIWRFGKLWDQPYGCLLAGRGLRRQNSWWYKAS